MKLKYISLELNRIRTFDFNLNMLPKLEILILAENHLTTLKEGVFNYFFVNEKGPENNATRTLEK